MPLSASRARLPATLRSCAQPGAMQPAGPSATQRRGTAATAGAGATIGTRESSGRAADAHGGRAGACQQLAAGQLSGR